MANGPLSPVMLIASAGLIDNQGLAPAANLISAINAYTSSQVVSSYDAVVAASSGILTSGTIDLLTTLGNSTLPALTNVTYANYYANIGNAWPFTSVLYAEADRIMGNGDLSKFAQVYGTCNGYKFTANQFLASSQNTQSLDETFINMDALSTGGLSLVSNDISVLAADLSNLGSLINLADLTYLGYPSALLRQVLAQGGLLPAIRTNLRQSGVSDKEINDLVDDPLSVSASTEKNIYTAMTNITGDNLTQVLFMLDVDLSNLNTMADLLNPVKILPFSYGNLVLFTSNGILPVYLSNGSPAPGIREQFASNTVFSTLAKIIPSDQALGNSAFSRSLYQVQNISNLTLVELARSALAVENNAGLTDINDLTQPVPESTVNAIVDTLSPSSLVTTATGENGKFTLFDFIGTAAGWPHASNLASVTGNIELMQNSGDLGDLIDSPDGAFIVMFDVLDDVYGNATSGPVTGLPALFSGGEPFANAEVCFTSSLIPVTSNIIANIANTSTYSANVSSDWISMNEQLVREKLNQTAAQLDFTNLQANSLPSILNLGTTLHDIGTSIELQGPAEFFEAVANVNSQSGQAVIASMREGRNIKSLENAGIGMGTQLSAN